MTSPESRDDEYRGSKNWEGLLKSTEEPEAWDPGFRAFLIKYGMLNHVAYDVFLERPPGIKSGRLGLSRYGDDLEAFTKGLIFKYQDIKGNVRTEYDFTNDYKVVANIIGSPEVFCQEEENFFGFVAISSDKKEMVIVFRGTLTRKEWGENVNFPLVTFDEDKGVSSDQNLMVHRGFQQIYMEHGETAVSPRATIRECLREHIPNGVEKILIVGHSLGAALAMMAGFDIVHNRATINPATGEAVPVTLISWAAPRMGNAAVAELANSYFPKLRHLRVCNPNDIVPKVPPRGLISSLFNLNLFYTHWGTEFKILNNKLHALDP
ncbi:unnamed protein product, partial [Discosporangium mesarthrocarpum]